MEKYNSETIKYNNTHRALIKICVTNRENKSLPVNGNKNVHKVNSEKDNHEETRLTFYQHKIRAKKFDLF